MKYVVLALSSMLAAIVGGGVVLLALFLFAAKREASGLGGELPNMPAPMPGPVNPPSPNKPDGVIRGTRVEVLDAKGQLAILFYVDAKGAPLAVVRDGEIARTIDLAKVARLAK